MFEMVISINPPDGTEFINHLYDFSQTMSIYALCS